ncbi:PKD domain-containing protein [Methanoregula sp.]|uniref:PKD domain-containing protein n=1 Tax=Methanoregula sp. TaxID=2052170 RepID=UPI002639F5CA|nr:PKD domain-containing protein [Methanoregula sp.]MDD5144041.1 PKD domain-containing protein [Methanoregula sp.]
MGSLPNSYQKIELFWNKSQSAIQTESNPYTIGSSNPVVVLPVSLMSSGSNTGYYDWIFVRQLADTEPALVFTSQGVTPPVADFSAGETGGAAPFTVHFTDKSTNSPIVWMWDFNNDGIVDSTEQNPTYAYTNTGIYSINLTVKNAGGSSSLVKTDYISVTSSPPLANFSTALTDGYVPLTVTFTDSSTGTITNWSWDFNNDGTMDSNEQNPSHTYYTAGNYTVNLTVTGPDGSNSIIKSDFIQVSSNAGDLQSNLLINPPVYSPFANLGNGIRIDLRNNGPGTIVGPVNASIVYNGTMINVTYGSAGAGSWVSYGWTLDNLTIPPGNTVTTYISDPTIYRYGESVPYTVTCDPDNLITETDETNNIYSTHVATVYNGYGSKRYTDGSDLITRRTYDLNGNLIVSFGNSAYKSASTQWTSSNLPVPTGAKIIDARLYSFYNWDNSEVMKNVSADGTHAAVFNNIRVPVSAHYTDRKGYGGYSGYDYPFGSVVYNVTDVFDPSGNNVTVTDSWPPITGMVLVVVYENPAETRKVIFLNDEFDLFYQTSGDTGMAHAPFTGPAISTTTMKRADLLTIAPHADDRGNLYFNGNEWTKSWNYGGAQVGYNSREVTSLVKESGNEAIFECDGETFAAATAILKVEYEGSASSVPVAGFTVATTSGTAPFTAQFSDASTNTPSSWFWDFGDGDNTNATKQNPVHTYANAGNYTVNLTATNADGSNFKVMSEYIAVTGGSPGGDAPVANFTVVLDGEGKMPHGLAPVTVSFTDSSTGTVDTYLWEYRNYNESAWTAFGSGARSPSNLAFPRVGTYDIRLTVTNAMYGSSNKTIRHAFTAGKLHDTLTTIRNGTVSGGLYILSQSPWDGTTATYTYDLPASGSNITWAQVFVNDYSGSGLNNLPVRITTEFDGDGDGTFETVLGTEDCDIQSESNTNSPNKQPYAYPLNDHVTKVFSDYEAWYDVTNLITSAHPKIRVTSSNIGAPVGKDGGYDGRLKAVTLVAAYNDGDTDQVKYVVNHGNDWMTGSSSTALDAGSFAPGWTEASITEVAHSSADATHTLNGNSLTPLNLGSNDYWKYNSFNVTRELKPAELNTFAFTNGGPSFKISLATLAVRYPGTPATTPVAAFSAAPASGTAPLTVTFTDTSTNTPTGWLWDFGDNDATNATKQNPVHTYVAAGTYTVNLTATNSAGSNSKRVTGYITVTAATVPPVAAFSANVTSGPAPLAVLFHDDSTMGEPTAWLWDFGDGSTSDVQDVEHVYLNAGTYAVNLTVTNAAGGSSHRVTNYITVGPAGSAPVAIFSVDKKAGTAPVTIVFTDKSTGSPTSWHWDFGDGTSVNATVQHPVHTYAANGNYTVNLTVTNAAGSSFLAIPDCVTVGAEVTPTPTPGVVKPVPAFIANRTVGDMPFAVKFTDGSTNAPTSWSWDFGDGITSDEQNPVHRYLTNGTYTVRLTATNAAGSSTATKTAFITVIAPVVEKNKFIVHDVKATIVGGVQNVSINMTANVTQSGNIVTITNTSSWSSMAITLAGTPEPGAGIVNGTVGSVRAVTEPVTVTEPIASVGSPTVQIALNMSAMPGEDAAITQTITKDPDPAAQTSFTLFVEEKGKEINDIAYTLNIQKAELANAGDGGANAIIESATLTMTVSEVWVNEHGDVSELAVLRKAEDGTTEILIPEVTGPDAGIFTLTVISPNGLSVFSVASISTTSSTPDTPSSGSSSVNGGDDGPSTSSSTVSSVSKFQLAPIDPSTGPWSTYQMTGQTHISKISVQTIGTLKDMFVISEKISSLPQGLPYTGAKVYEYQKIDVYHATEDDIHQGIIEFTVSESWLNEQEMTFRDVQLLRYHDKAWEKLPTEYVGKKDGQFMFKATTEGFSYFATALIKNATIIPETAPQVMESEPVPTRTISAEKNTARPTVTHTMAAPMETEVPKETGSAIPLFAVGIVGIIILCVTGFFARTWWTRRKNPTLFRDEPYFKIRKGRR